MTGAGFSMVRKCSGNIGTCRVREPAPEGIQHSLPNGLWLHLSADISLSSSLCHQVFLTCFAISSSQLYVDVCIAIYLIIDHGNCVSNSRSRGLFLLFELKTDRMMDSGTYLLFVCGPIIPYCTQALGEYKSFSFTQGSSCSSFRLIVCTAHYILHIYSIYYL